MTIDPERPLPQRRRLGRTLQVLAVAALVYVVPSLAAAVPVNRLGLAPMQSGLSWRSGASFCTGKDPNWVSWRGRPVDVIHQFVQHSTWEEMHYKLAQGTNLKNAVANAPQISVTLAPWPDSLGRGRHAQCARGDFDAHFKQFGADLARRGAGTAIVRIGHEPNATTSHVWGIETLQQAQDWKVCFRRLAAALKNDSGDVVKGKRQFKIEWNNARRGKLPFNIMETYPGDDVVDIWGLNVYDQGPEVTSLAVWNEYYIKTHNGGPWGLGAWLAEAKKHGKPLAFTEWGAWNFPGRLSSADNPLYIQVMNNFFRTNAADIAYETYYTCPLKHRVGPAGTTVLPRASEAYRVLW
jgi:hypothetical protein